MWVWLAGANVGIADDSESDGVDGDLMQMGDVTANVAGDDEKGETGKAMLDIIWKNFLYNFNGSSSWRQMQWLILHWACQMNKK